MSAIMLILNILSVTLLILLGLCLLFLIVPIRYKVDGGYLNHFWFNINLRCSPLIMVRGSLKNSPEEALYLQLVILGIPITLHPEKWKKKEKTEEKDNKSGSRFMSIIDRDLRVRGIALVSDLLHILKPDRLEIKGRIGFDEPHLTGWLAALYYSLKHSSCGNTSIDIEPIWEEEHYDLNFLLEGRVMTGLILLKITGFVIGRFYHNTFGALKEKVNLS